MFAWFVGEFDKTGAKGAVFGCVSFLFGLGLLMKCTDAASVTCIFGPNALADGNDLLGWRSILCSRDTSVFVGAGDRLVDYISVISLMSWSASSLLVFGTGDLRKTIESDCESDFSSCFEGFLGVFLCDESVFGRRGAHLVLLWWSLLVLILDHGGRLISRSGSRCTHRAF